MSKTFYTVILLTVAFVLPSSLQAYPKPKDKDVQTIIHLLEYVSKDYSGAVQNGKVISKQEFREMQEFGNKIYKITKQAKFLPKNDTILLPEILKLNTFIKKKKSAQEIRSLARKIKNKIIKTTGFQTSPKNWPDLKKGQNLFLKNCTACHGIKGNGQGKLSKSFKPAPANFLDDSLMRHISPFQAYNTINLGINGTGMQGFPTLTNEQLWNLAFYVKSLRFRKKTIDSTYLRKEFKKAHSNLSLKDVATLSDTELLSVLSKKTDSARTKLKALRLLSTSGDNSKNTLLIAKKDLKAAVKYYAGGNKTLARTKALDAYLEGIEPVEVRLRANDPDFTANLEQQMLGVRQVIEENKGEQALKNETHKALALIGQAEKLMKDKKLNYWLSFILAASVMLREGLEAFLILAVILALIRTSGVKKALPWLHGGWIFAIIMGFAGWFLSDWIIQFGGKNREIMEGLVSILAVFVLLFVGFWLHNNSHTKKWKQFIEEKISRHLQKDKMFGLAVFSFMVVFREAFEVILFLQAISLETKPGNKSAIGLGVLTAFGCIALLVYLFLKYSKKIPVRQLFRYSSWIIAVLAVILMGKGIHAIQESGWVSVTGLSDLFKIDWLGIYPTTETILAQVFLLATILTLYIVSNQRSKNCLS